MDTALTLFAGVLIGWLACALWNEWRMPRTVKKTMQQVYFDELSPPGSQYVLTQHGFQIPPTGGKSTVRDRNGNIISHESWGTMEGEGPELQ